MYSGNQLIQLLQKQHQARGNSDLFKQETFTIEWRAKVGSFPHPDLETMISAGEPCGNWQQGQPSNWRPEGKRNVGVNWQELRTLPLNGYIPGSSIRGLVRAWASPDIKQRMFELLGNQENNSITAGKIEFFDAWPTQPTKLTLDIVNPQQDFQVYHQGQSTPLSLYTLGDSKTKVAITVAIRGTKNATAEEVNEVWDWVKQALSLYGVGSRTASGYGSLKPKTSLHLKSDPNVTIKEFDFTLYSQGNAGPNIQEMEFRPSHWRGWLRSWLLRFFLGVMSQDNAQKTVGELMGTLEPETRKGCVRLEMITGEIWGKVSENNPRFYSWNGKLKVSAPTEILNKIILPIIRFAVMVGGVGRGWRRPLHIFHMNNDRAAARGSHLILKHRVKKSNSQETEIKLYGISLNEENWTNNYQSWLDSVRNKWADRIITAPLHSAEVFSPRHCAIYVVPEPVEEPINRKDFKWDETNAVDTRGLGMNLIYQPTYKRKKNVGGDAAGGGNAHCSWVSIKRVNVPNKQEETNCQEVVCLFLGTENNLRSQFLGELANIDGAVHLFGVKPNLLL